MDSFIRYQFKKNIYRKNDIYIKICKHYEMKQGQDWKLKIFVDKQVEGNELSQNKLTTVFLLGKFSWEWLIFTYYLTHTIS